MGFLLGAFGKLAAGSRRRAIQARMMRIQSRSRRVTREVKTVEDMISRLEKNQTQNITLNNSAMKQMYSNNMMAQMYNNDKYKSAMETIQKYQSDPNSCKSDDVSLASSTVSQVQNQFNQYISNVNAQVDTQAQMQKLQVEQYVEYLRDTVLTPLKDEEDNLQSEKESLESEIQIVDADYKACKDMEKNDAKDLAPSYTAGQG